MDKIESTKFLDVGQSPSPEAQLTPTLLDVEKMEPGSVPGAPEFI